MNRYQNVDPIACRVVSQMNPWKPVDWGIGGGGGLKGKMEASRRGWEGNGHDNNKQRDKRERHKERRKEALWRVGGGVFSGSGTKRGRGRNMGSKTEENAVGGGGKSESNERELSSEIGTKKSTWVVSKQFGKKEISQWQKQKKSSKLS